MPRKKTTQAPQAAATAAPAEGARMTKMEAVRRALAKLGRDAKPLQLREFIRSEFGIEMSADHISTYKGVLLKKAGGKSKPGPNPPQGAAPAARAVSPAGLTLDDIRAVKQLVDRLGADRLRELAEVLAR
jgi:hypothetical protein